MDVELYGRLERFYIDNIEVLLIFNKQVLEMLLLYLLQTFIKYQN